MMEETKKKKKKKKITWVFVSKGDDSEPVRLVVSERTGE